MLRIFNKKCLLSVKQFNNFTKLNVSNFKRSSKLYLNEDHVSILSKTIAKADLTFQDFNSLRQEIIKIDRNINEINVDSCIVGFCCKDLRLDTAKLYLEFLKSQNIEVNFATFGKLLKLYYSHFLQNGPNQEAESEILNM